MEYLAFERLVGTRGPVMDRKDNTVITRRPLAAACLFLAACSGGSGGLEAGVSLPGEPTSIERSPTEIPAVTPGPEPTVTSEAPPIQEGFGNGIMLMTCVPNLSVQLDLINPATGGATGRRSFRLENNGVAGAPLVRSSMPCGPPGSGFIVPYPEMFRQQFDVRYERMAIEIELSTCCNHHVGYVDTNGQMVDATAQFAPGGYADAPNQTSAIFSATADELWYVDALTNSDAKLDLASGEITQVGGSSGAFLLDAASLERVPRPYIPNPWGGLAVGDASGPTDMVVLGWTEATRLPNGQACNPQAWIDEFRMVCSSDDGHIVLANWESGQPVSETVLLPQSSDRWSYSIQPSPDGQQLAFLSTQDRAMSLWVVDVDASATPRMLIDGLGESAVPWLVAWH